MKHREATMTATIDAQRAAELEQAFALFNATSRELQSAWSTLEARVAELTRERDDAERERLRELAERERLAGRMQGLLEALPAAALMLDRDGRIRESNAGAHELLGDPLLGQRWADVAARALRAASDVDGAPRLADGRRLGVSRRSLSDGGSVLLLTDDSAAHAHRSGVERQRRLSARDQDNARLAHQLRTPLATAVLYLSRLAGSELDSATGRRLAGKALAPLRQLQELIDGMLALARGQLDEAEAIPLAALLQELRGDAASRLANGVRLQLGDVPVHAQVRGQRPLLRSALLNLLENALAVARTVDLDVDGDERGWHIHIRDDGPGVPAAVAARIFDPFFTTRHDGTGLGLATARSVARAHGGDLQLAASAPGAHFVLTLPHADAGRLLPSGAHVALPQARSL